MFQRLYNLFVTVNKIHKKQRPSVTRQFVFIFYMVIFCPSQAQGFLTRSLGKAFLGRQQVDFLSWLCFVKCLIAAMFCILFRL